MAVILAGIDEAGLGPTLGPLVVGCAALSVPTDWQADTPWEALGEAIARKPSKRDTRPVVGDSKAVYSRLGRQGLERTLGCFLDLAGTPLPAEKNALRQSMLTSLDASLCLAECPRYPWYEADTWNAEPATEEDADNRRRAAEVFAEAGARVVYLSGRPLLAGSFNDRIDAGLNKSELLLSQTGAHLQSLAEHFPQEELRVVIDKQGGRDRYHPWLMSVFPGEWIDILVEGASASDYRVRRPDGDIHLHIAPKADAGAFCTSLASIIAKSLRERFMDDLNAFFATHRPGLKPTAGYVVDARRFLSEVDDLIDSLDLDRALLIRQR